MGKGLLAAKVRSSANCEQLASTLGLDMAAYKTCVADPATDERIFDRIAWLDEKDYPGLPVIWIENQELLGAQTTASLRAAWRRAEEHKSKNRHVSGAQFYDVATGGESVGDVKSCGACFVFFVSRL